MKKKMLHKVMLVVASISLGCAAVSSDALARGGGGGGGGHGGGGFGGGGHGGGGFGAGHIGGGLGAAHLGGHFGPGPMARGGIGRTQMAGGHSGPGPVVHHNPYVVGAHAGREPHRRFRGTPYYWDYGSCWPNEYPYNNNYPYGYCY